MRIDQATLDSNYILLQDVTDIALCNPETFRKEGQRALKAYTRRERSIIKHITASLSVGKFFELWQAELQSPRNTIRASQQSKTFLNSLQKYLLLKDRQSSQVAESLIAKQDEEMVRLFIESLHIADTHDGAITYRTIEKVLQWSDDHLLSLQEHYAQAVVFTAVANQQHVHIFDPHAHPLVRLAATSAIRRERARLSKKEAKALRTIDHTLKVLTKNELMIQTLSTKLEPIEFFSARAAYEKKLATIDPKEASQLTTRSELMMQESRHLKSAYHTLKNDITSDTLSMHDASFDELIRHLFSLSTIQKNQFMLDVKKYRELLKEKEEILVARTAREAVIRDLL